MDYSIEENFGKVLYTFVILPAAFSFGLKRFSKLATRQCDQVFKPQNSRLLHYVYRFLVLLHLYTDTITFFVFFWSLHLYYVVALSLMRS